MTPKKSPHADIEKKRFGFLQIGFIVSVGLTLAAFEYTSFEENQKKIIFNPGTTCGPEGPVYIPPKPKPAPEPPKKIKNQNKNQKQNSSSAALSSQFKKVDDDTKEKTVGTIGDTIPVNPWFNTDTNTTSITSPDDFIPVEDWPYFLKFKKIKNGMERKKKTEEEMSAFIGNQVKYTEKMNQLRVEGVVKVAFVVDKQGKVDPNRIKVIRGLHEDLDQQVVKAVLLMPQLVPGTQRGRPVDVPYVIPIKFKLE